MTLYTSVLALHDMQRHDVSAVNSAGIHPGLVGGFYRRDVQQLRDDDGVGGKTNYELPLYVAFFG